MQLFGESPSRFIISFSPSALVRAREIAEENDCPLTLIGETGGDELNIKVNAIEAIRERVKEIENMWRTSLARRLARNPAIVAA